MDTNELSSLRYTSREYLSIFEDLYKAIPTMTDKWTSREETDPGIVLVKLMAMLGDMLSYTQDKQALEVYPATVTQRKNANQIFGLLGYRLHWYVSATCEGSFQRTSSSGETIPPYSVFTTSNNIKYSNLQTITLTTTPSNWSLMQGAPVLPATNPNPTSDVWYDKYLPNIMASDIVDNRYYFAKGTAIAEESIFLIDDTGIQWQYPDYAGTSRISLDLESADGRFFEINIDEYDTPYIQFPQNWNKAVGSYEAPGSFRLFYLQSLGSNGSINENTLSDPQRRLISNTASTTGSDPETPEEARLNIDKYRNTLNTLITLRDYQNAVLRLDNVNNCLATDIMTDPYPTPKHTINLYVIPSAQVDEGSAADKENFKSSIYASIRDFTCVPLTTNIYLHNDPNAEDVIQYYEWSPTGEVYLHAPVSAADGQEILTKINTRLQYVYSTANVSFNTPINYVNLVSEIMDADSRIRYVNLDNLVYNGGSITAKDISGKATGLSGTVSDDSVTFTNLGSITPGSLSITVVINGMKYELRDYGYPDENGMGSMATVMYLNRTDPLVSSSVDYRNGVVDLVFSNDVTSATANYNKNKIGICHYAGIALSLDNNDFYIAPESLKI